MESEESRFLRTVLEKEWGSSRAGALAGQFETLEEFINTNFAGYVIRSDGREVALGDDDTRQMERIKEFLYPDATTCENWVRFTTRRAVLPMLEKIRNTTLADIRPNPFLIRMLGQRDPDRLVRFHTYQHVSRSLVTSMGNAMEHMLASVRGTRLGTRREWFDVILEADDGVSYWIQAKSGPNNVNKDQMQKFNEKFNDKEDARNKPILGIMYGRADDRGTAVDSHKNYLDDWETRLKIGSELWEFVSGREDYHMDVLEWIEREITAIMRGRPVESEIDDLAGRLQSEFLKKYGTGEDAVRRYIYDAF
ncbi:MAG: hypothetical protein MPI91_06745 [Nitrosopumilus sp.]|nr:hypothetical protein [Nitrosopumilus sp.]